MSERKMIAERAAQELSSGDVVNLGIGLPTLVANYIPNDMDIYLHSENGILGVGPSPSKDDIDEDLVNANKVPVTVLKGASFFDSPQSFAMIRGRHVDVAILGALQVDQAGRIANWAIPGENILGVGGAMDLLEGTKKVIITMFHNTKSGEPKIVNDLSYPITSERKVDFVITDKAVFQVKEKGLTLIELAPNQTVEDIIESTGTSFIVSEKLK